MATLYDNFKNRKLVSASENKISYFQIIGFVLILLGLSVLFVAVCFDKANVMAASFFITMMGMSFVFPDLLMDKNKGLSTMRIAVFMIVNVFCLLVIKIGWDKESFQQIGIDQYWVAILAFVFGAKAAQAFFESKMAENSENEPSMTDQTLYFDQLSKEKQHELASEAITTLAHDWKVQFPEITGLSVANKKLDKDNKALNVYCIVFQVKIKQNIKNEFPKTVCFNGYVIPTDVQEYDDTVALFGVKGLENGISRNGDSEFGTLGITVTDGNNYYILSCYHVYFNNELKINKRKVLPSDIITNPSIVCPCAREGGVDVIGDVYEGELNDWLDFGILKLNGNYPILQKFKLLPGPNGVRYLIDSDKNNLEVKYWGNGSKRVRNGKVLNTFSGQWVKYNGKEQFINGLIQIDVVGARGDSGAPVVDLLGNVIGILIAADDKTSYVLSAYQIENKTKYKIKR